MPQAAKLRHLYASACVSIHACIRKRTCQHTPGYVSAVEGEHMRMPQVAQLRRLRPPRQHTSAYASVRQRTPAYTIEGEHIQMLQAAQLRHLRLLAFNTAT
jgi:hypothetical protein